MAATINPSRMHLRITKANSAIMVVIAIATAVSVFCLVSSKALISQAAYQRRVLHERRVTLGVLDKDQSSVTTLMDQYTKVFEGSSSLNYIGGKNDSSASAVPPNGTNSRIVLDSLPTSYDFPALISSVSSILSSAGITNPSISGTDQTATASNTPMPSPQPVPIVLSVGGTGSYGAVQQLVSAFERSTRPFDITNIQLSGSSSSMTINLQMTTYYQPAKAFTVGSKEVQ